MQIESGYLSRWLVFPSFDLNNAHTHTHRNVYKRIGNREGGDTQVYNNSRTGSLYFQQPPPKNRSKPWHTFGARGWNNTQAFFLFFFFFFFLFRPTHNQSIGNWRQGTRSTTRVCTSLSFFCHLLSFFFFFFTHYQRDSLRVCVCVFSVYILRTLVYISCADLGAPIPDSLSSSRTL